MSHLAIFGALIAPLKEDWDAAAEDCPGMNHGTLHDQSSIEAGLQDDGLP